MTKCKKYQTLIEKCLEGCLNNRELAQLKAHIEQCGSCRDEFAGLDRVRDIINAAFCPATTAHNAADSILSALHTTPIRSLSRPLFTKQMAVAAGVLLVAGLLLGFGLARITTAKQYAAIAEHKVPIRVTDLEGTVLVRHKGSEVWQSLEAGSDVYLGDTFHSTAKSALVLELEDKSTLELSQNSMLELKLYDGETVFYLEHGVLAAALESPHGPFFISTPHGRVEALGTEFTVTVE